LLSNDIIHIVLSADAKYAMPLAVAISSAAANCDRKRRLAFYVIQSGINRDLRRKVEASLARTGFPNAWITWIDAPLDRIASFKLGHAHRYTSSLTFARLLIPELLSAELKKALYLDCDIAVVEDIGPLWDTSIAEKSLLAVRDLTGYVNQGGVTNYEELGIPGQAYYFNAGVLLINLEKWRERGITEQLLKHLWTHRASIRLADQEALNAILWNDWGELDFRWNWQIVWRDGPFGRAKLVWAPDTTRKSIVHFVTAEKPWLPGCDYDERKYFFEYLDRTDWAGLRVSWWREFLGRSERELRDAKYALGMLRRRVFSRASWANHRSFLG
jgi:lipopolysaccharide biosynthesis glycosyltransferase